MIFKSSSVNITDINKCFYCPHGKKKDNNQQDRIGWDTNNHIFKIKWSAYWLTDYCQQQQSSSACT